MRDLPNVLLICADHWSGGMGGWAGSPWVLTPTIDRLARNGVTFDNAYSACPVCVPARRTLMTGMTTRSHGMRSNKSMPMPEAPTLAQCFSDSGYQTFAVGKLHVTPQRSRIGFHDVLACEEGRHPVDMPDDWEMFLAEKGCGGRQYAAAGTQNDYLVTPWHLPDDCHPTNWAAREMSRVIKRRERDCPAFWYLSFVGPHPPIWPLPSYLEMARDLQVPAPMIGEWVETFNRSALPSKMDNLAASGAPPEFIALVRKAFFATINHIDHQIRTVLGTLREEGLADNTLIAFTSDHGEMLGNHGMWGKCLFYEESSRIPLVVAPPRAMDVGQRGRIDNRLVELGDIMPTLLELCGLPVPASVEGQSVFSSDPRSEIYGEYGDGAKATRMIRRGPFKLIYYPAGNQFQLFNVKDDPTESKDLLLGPGNEEVASELRTALAGHLYGGDRDWVSGHEWTGLPVTKSKDVSDFQFSGQRGQRF